MWATISSGKGRATLPWSALLPTELSSVEWKYALRLYGMESLVKRFLMLSPSGDPTISLSHGQSQIYLSYAAMGGKELNDGVKPRAEPNLSSGYAEASHRTWLGQERGTRRGDRQSGHRLRRHILRRSSAAHCRGGQNGTISISHEQSPARWSYAMARNRTFKNGGSRERPSTSADANRANLCRWPMARG